MQIEIPDRVQITSKPTEEGTHIQHGKQGTITAAERKEGSFTVQLDGDEEITIDSDEVFPVGEISPF